MTHDTKHQDYKDALNILEIKYGIKFPQNFRTQISRSLNVIGKNIFYNHILKYYCKTKLLNKKHLKVEFLNISLIL